MSAQAPISAAEADMRLGSQVPNLSLMNRNMKRRELVGAAQF